MICQRQSVEIPDLGQRGYRLSMCTNEAAWTMRKLKKWITAEKRNGLTKINSMPVDDIIEALDCGARLAEEKSRIDGDEVEPEEK